MSAHAEPERRSWWRRHPLRSQALVALLAALLGFAVVVQLRSNQTTSGLAGARQEDLVRILDDLNARTERLRAEIDELERAREELTGGADRDAAALAESRRREQLLGILAGTLAARGPGIVLTITDPNRSVDAAVLLDTMQELRDAGAEAIEVNDVRLIASSHFEDTADGVALDGRVLAPPYVFVAIGDTHTLAEAMAIPGGVVDVVAGEPGAKAAIQRRGSVLVDALRALPTPRYARPASEPPGS